MKTELVHINKNNNELAIKQSISIENVAALQKQLVSITEPINKVTFDKGVALDIAAIQLLGSYTKLNKCSMDINNIENKDELNKLAVLDNLNFNEQ